MANKKKSKKNLNPIELKNQERSLNKAKKHTKRNKQSRKPRQRDWLDYADAPEDAIDTFERIMPLDERDRRRHVEDVMATGPQSDDPDADTPLADVPHARVTEVSSGLCRVATGDTTLLCSLKGTLKAAETGYSNVVAVGDHVVVTETGNGDGLVEEILPRRNVLARPDPAAPHLQQILAANLDQLLIVGAWRNPHIWFELVDRYLITAERHGITPLICVNKVDLAEPDDDIDAALAPYTNLGYRVVQTSAEQGIGIKTLRLHLHNQVTVVAGLSGVGKSSLLSAVQPGFNLKTGETNADREQGRHTTTQALMLPFGDGYVVDTPGIREFGLAGLDASELMAYYPDLLGAAMHCKFADCTHTHEPDCAVREQVFAGELSATRYKSYQAIRVSLGG